MMADRAANDADAVPITVRFISKPAQEFRALGSQGKCNCDHGKSSARIWLAYEMSQAARMRYLGVASTIWTTKLFFSPAAGLASVAGVVDPDISFPMDAI